MLYGRVVTEPHHLPKSPFLVPFSGGFSLSERSTRPQVNLSKSESKERLEDLGKEMDKRQRVRYASRRPPVLVVLQGMDAAGPSAQLLRADFDWPKPDRRREFLRVKLNAEGGLDLFPNQSSGVLTSTVWADGLVDTPAGQPIARGDLVRFLPLDALVNR